MSVRERWRLKGWILPEYKGYSGKARENMTNLRTDHALLRQLYDPFHTPKRGVRHPKLHITTDKQCEELAERLVKKHFTDPKVWEDILKAGFWHEKLGDRTYYREAKRAPPVVRPRRRRRYGGVYRVGG